MSIHEELVKQFDEEVLERATQTVQKNEDKDYEDFSESDWGTVKLIAEQIAEVEADQSEEQEEAGTDEANEPQDADSGEAPEVDELDLTGDGEGEEDGDDSEEMDLVDHDELESNVEAFLQGEKEFDEAISEL